MRARIAGSPGVGSLAAKASPAERILEPTAAVAAAAADVFRKLRRDWVTSGFCVGEKGCVLDPIYGWKRAGVREPEL
jgi:hypothetical protein